MFVKFSVLIMIIYFSYMMIVSGKEQPARPLSNLEIHNIIVGKIEQDFPDFGAGIEIKSWLVETVSKFEKEHNYDVNFRTTRESYKILYENPETKEELDELKWTRDIDCQYNEFKDATLLFLIAYLGDLESFKWLVEEKKMNVNFIDCSNMTVAHYAGLRGHFSIVRYLLQETDFKIELLNIAPLKNNQGGLTVYQMSKNMIEINHAEPLSSRRLNQEFLKQYNAKTAWEVYYFQDCIDGNDRGKNFYKLSLVEEEKYRYDATNHSCKVALRQMDDRLSKTLSGNPREAAEREIKMVRDELLKRDSNFDFVEWEVKKGHIDLL